MALSGNQAEKWMVAVLHELLRLLLWKKTQRDNLLCLKEYLGFGTRFKKVSDHHPGLFYFSNELKTKSVMQEGFLGGAASPDGYEALLHLFYE
ncbi:hypothetical protein NL676_002774 [Syzygium grande]|nr:hypothetical protein NL676_002774 [Syzygium grande]